MGKVNEELKAKLVFERRENQGAEDLPGKQIIISTTHEGIYRQYSFYDNGTNDDTEMASLYEEIKYILAHAIQRALDIKEKYLKNYAMTGAEIEEAKRMGL